MESLGAPPSPPCCAEPVELVKPPIPVSEIFCPYRMFSAVFSPCSFVAAPAEEVVLDKEATERSGVFKSKEQEHTSKLPALPLRLLRHRLDGLIPTHNQSTKLYESIDLYKSILSRFPTSLGVHCLAFAIVHLKSLEAVVPVTSKNFVD